MQKFVCGGQQAHDAVAAGRRSQLAELATEPLGMASKGGNAIDQCDGLVHGCSFRHAKKSNAKLRQPSAVFTDSSQKVFHTARCCDIFGSKPALLMESLKKSAARTYESGRDSFCWSVSDVALEWLAALVSVLPAGPLGSLATSAWI